MSDYVGPVIAAEGSEFHGAPWIWVANGTDATMFAPPVVRKRPPPLPPEGFSADRILESFRVDALDLDLAEPFDEDIPGGVDEVLEEIEPDDQVPAPPDQTAQSSQIRVLGPVEAWRWASSPERPIVIELACYLALHRDRPVSGESLRAALRPDGSKEQSAKTLRTYLSMLRKGLGPNALPSRPSGGYQLSGSITTDWERFVELSHTGELDDALEALSLIRGRPFEGVPSGTYAWVFSEFLVSEMEVAIAAVVTRSVEQLVKGGDLERALGAVRQGLRAVSGDYGLWELYLSIGAQAGPAALARARTEARAALGDDAPLD